MKQSSPYKNIRENLWVDVTRQLIKEHPLSIKLMKDVILKSWNIILTTKLGKYQIGKNIFPNPQIMDFFCMK